jgi:hypothetical protein
MDLSPVNAPGGGTGKVGNCLDTEAGSTQRVIHAQAMILNQGNHSFSWSVWVNAESISNTPVILRSGDAAQNRYVLYIATSAGSVFRWGVIGATASALAPSTATWYHLVVWYDSVNNQIGIAVNDGTPVTAALTSVAPPAGGGEFQLGASSDQGFYWDGLIDQAGFWKRLLTSQERTDLYNGGNGLSYGQMLPAVHPSAIASAEAFGAASVSRDEAVILDSNQHHVTFENCTFENGAKGIVLAGNNHALTNCLVRNCSGDGIEALVSDSTFSGVESHSNSGRGIYVAGSNNVIDSCKAHGNGGDGIKVA